MGLNGVINNSLTLKYSYDCESIDPYFCLILIRDYIV